MSDTTTYTAPVRGLIDVGEPHRGIWPDHLEAGLGQEHVDELIQMATDPDLLWAVTGSPESWAPVHAWRALGQLRAEPAVTPLISLLDYVEDDDWMTEDLPKVFELIGQPAVGPLTEVLNDESRGWLDRATAAESLRRIAAADPTYRSGGVATLTAALSRFELNDSALNSLIMGDLVDLGAVESAPVIEAAFKSGRIDLRHLGDWEDVQIALGLLSERLTPSIFANPGNQHTKANDGHSSASQTRSKAHAKAKARRKAARQSRNRNRNRR